MTETSKISIIFCASCKKWPGEGKKFSVCSKCNSANYCSKDCQKNDWKLHKPICKQFKDTIKRLNLLESKIEQLTSDEVKTLKKSQKQLKRKSIKDLFTITPFIAMAIKDRLIEAADLFLRVNETLKRNDTIVMVSLDSIKAKLSDIEEFISELLEADTLIADIKHISSIGEEMLERVMEGCKNDGPEAFTVCFRYGVISCAVVMCETFGDYVEE